MCKLGFHKWEKPTFTTNFSSNVVEWKMICSRCRNSTRWIQPKGVNVKYYPNYWLHKLNWWFVLLVVIGILLFLALVNVVVTWFVY
jgi:hypothetical protein